MRVRSFLASSFCIALLCVLTMRSTPSVAETKTTADFIRLCEGQNPSNRCLLEYETVLAANGDWGGGASHPSCPPSDDLPINSPRQYVAWRTEIAAVVGWLKSRPDLNSQSDAESIGSAASALYPCRKQQKKD
jgi:hypothetical protein